MRDAPVTGAEATSRILASLNRRRLRDDRLDRGTWHGLTDIAGGLSIPRAKVKAALEELVALGEIERMTFSNAIAYRGRKEACLEGAATVAETATVAPDDATLWKAGCMTRGQIANWSDSDLQVHSSGVRKTLQFLLSRLDALSARLQPPQQPVAVKPLEWVEDWAGEEENIPVWRGQNPLGLTITVDFADRWKAGIRRHADAPVFELATKQANAEIGYVSRIRSALYAAPLAQPVATAGEENNINLAVAEIETKHPGWNWSVAFDGDGQGGGFYVAHLHPQVSGEYEPSFGETPADALLAALASVTQPNAEEAGK